MLGDALEPRADMVKEFIHNEIEFAYGKGCVAAVNPVSCTSLPWRVRPRLHRTQRCRAVT